MYILIAYNKETGNGQIHGIHDAMDIEHAQIITGLHGNLTKIGRCHYNITGFIYKTVYVIEWISLGHLDKLTNESKDIIFNKLIE